ncbi:uncharacterized protein LOC120344954 isoform X1 [Styela clava]
MKTTTILTAFCLLLAIKRGSSSVCEDLANGIEGDFTIEEVNECHECGWYKIQGDTRTSHSSSITPFTGADVSGIGNPESAWCADDEKDDYLQVDFGRQIKLAGLVTRGYEIADSWVTSYTVSYKNKNDEYQFVKDMEGNIKIFTGNEDGITIVDQKFPVPLNTSVIRIYPTAHHTAACMQADVYACTKQVSSDVPSPLLDASMADFGILSTFCKIDVFVDCKSSCLKYKQDWFGCYTCECEVMKIGDKFESDILFTELTMAAAEASLGVTGGGGENEGIYKGASKLVPKWDQRSNGKVIVPYSYGAGLSSRAPASIQAAIRELSIKTCIKLVRRSNQPQYINFVSGGGCSSPVGRQYRGNQVSIGYGCEHMGTVVHEILHSLGFWHEQSRPDRDRHVRILTQNIQSGMAYNFQKRKNHEIDSFGSPYDLQSVMHYHGTAFSRNGQPTIVDMRGNAVRGQRGGLSVEDAKQVNRMYKCGNTGTGGGSTTVAPGTTKITTVSPGSCRDEHRHCSFWAGIGECNKNPGYMKLKCKKSCGECGGTTPSPSICFDGNGNCPSWAKNGECDRNPAYMKVNCKKSCAVCGGATCLDKNAKCPMWAKYCSSGTYSDYMTKYCPKTCEKC